jgi:hypothetical protein
MTRRMHYFGPSMNPTLKLGDGLLVVPYGDRPIRVGDVVVFADPDAPGAHVVHRVVAADGLGVRTKGDNLSAADPWVLAPEQIVGYVAAAVRQGRKFAPAPPGPLRLEAHRTLRRLDALLSRLLRPWYRRLAAAMPRRGRPAPRVLCFTRPGGREWQLWLGPWLIGRRLPGWTAWYIRRPFGLLVDERDLPGP